MRRNLRFFNAIALAVTIGVNYLSNTGYFNGATVGSMSARFSSLITPGSYAFTIWIVIYIGLSAFVIYHFRGTRAAATDIRQVGPWFILSCLLNCCWVLAWIYSHIDLSVIVILLLLSCLLRIMALTRMELTDPPGRTIVFLWWPFCLYIGWIVIASAVNIAAWVTWHHWSPFGFSLPAFSALLLCLAGAVYLFLTWWRNMREAGLVGAWGLIAVGMADRRTAPDLTALAWVLAGILLASSIIHGYRNRKYRPFLRRNEPGNARRS